MKVVQFARAVSLVAVLAVAQSVAARAEDAPAQAGTPATTATTTESAPAQTASVPAPAPGSSEEVVCKQEDATTGSRLGRHKICMTRKEWADLRNESQNTLKEIQTPSSLDGGKAH